jgi:UDP-N-acetylmuramoylalanine--D-glutamate ligase
MNYQEFFTGKRITVMGLGLLGRSIGDIRWLSQFAAEIVVTDKKTTEQLQSSIDQLSDIRIIRYVLGEHQMQDFVETDMVIKSAGVPLDSEYVIAAKSAGVPVYMSTALFTQFAFPDSTIIGVTGTRGKSTTTELIYEILKASGKRVHLGGNIRGVSTLPMIERVEKGDYIVLELDSWQLQGFGDLGISPHIAVFTNFMDDHLNYYHGDRSLYFADKANSYKNQRSEDSLVTSAEVVTQMVQYAIPASGNIYEVSPASMVDWEVALTGEHNKQNAAYAVTVAKLRGIDDAVTRQVVATWGGVPGRLQFLRTYKDRDIINDNNATSPDAVIAAIQSFPNKKVTLIIGGTTKNLDITNLAKEIQMHAHRIVLYSGTGTNEIRPLLEQLHASIVGEFETLSECVDAAIGSTDSGSVIVFSPGFASFNSQFNNEYERNDEFVRIVTTLAE